MAGTEKDTKSCPRRMVEYPTLEAVLADARRLVASGATTTGNWTLAQILEHLAKALEATVDGWGDLRVPAPLRWAGRLLYKKRILNGGMPPGFKLPPAGVKVLGPGDAEATAALARLEAAVAKFNAAESLPPHAFFGPMTKSESELLQRRHAEMHMSFVAEP